MKAILIILIVAIGGLAYKFQSDARSAKFLQTIAEDGERDAKIKAANLDAELSTARSEIAALKDILGRREDRIASLTDTEAKIAAEEARAEASRNAALADQDAMRSTEAKLQIRLAEMKKQYDFQRAALTEQKARLSTSIASANAQKQTLASNPPAFKKNPRDPYTIGGVSTSQADQERALAKHNEELSKITAQITAIQIEEAAVDTRFSELDAAYEAAVEKARAAAYAGK